MHSTRYGRQRQSLFLAKKTLGRQGRLWVACVQLWLAAAVCGNGSLRSWRQFWFWPACLPAVVGWGLRADDALAEWLRRRPAKPMGRVGSNPAGVGSQNPLETNFGWPLLAVEEPKAGGLPPLS